MAKYRVRGASIETGREVEVVVEAAHALAAQEHANRDLRIAVSHVDIDGQAPPATATGPSVMIRPNVDSEGFAWARVGKRMVLIGLLASIPGLCFWPLLGITGLIFWLGVIFWIIGACLGERAPQPVTVGLPPAPTPRPRIAEGPTRPERLGRAVRHTPQIARGLGVGISHYRREIMWAMFVVAGIGAAVGLGLFLANAANRPLPPRTLPLAEKPKSVPEIQVESPPPAVAATTKAGGRCLNRDGFIAIQKWVPLPDAERMVTRLKVGGQVFWPRLELLRSEVHGRRASFSEGEYQAIGWRFTLHNKGVDETRLSFFLTGVDAVGATVFQSESGKKICIPPGTWELDGADIVDEPAATALVEWRMFVY